MTDKQIAAMMSSSRFDWRTPQRVFDTLDEEFHFTLDAAASDDNHLCDRYYTEASDGLTQSWRGETVFVNPPYGRGSIARWCSKAIQETKQNKCNAVVMLLPARVNSRWFHDYVYNKGEIRFLKKRLHFDNTKNPAAFDSMVVIYRREWEL